jgi:hypothetical protein
MIKIGYYYYDPRHEAIYLVRNIRGPVIDVTWLSKPKYGASNDLNASFPISHCNGDIPLGDKLLDLERTVYGLD